MSGPAEPTNRMLIAASLLAVAVAVFHVFAIPVDNPYYGLFNNGLDLEVYRAGGEVIRDQSGLYDGPVVFGMEFTYTPFAALTFLPLTLISLVHAKTLWWLATMLALIALTGRCLLVLKYRNTVRTWVFAALLAVLSTVLEPVRTTIWLGQINVFLVLLIVWDLTRPAKAPLRGVGVGIAAGIKLTPAFFLLYLACTRQWRSLGIATGAFAATIAIGFALRPDDAYSYWRGQVTSAGRVGAVDSPGNQSVNGFLAQMLRFLDIQRFDTNSVFQPPTWMWLLALLPVVALGLTAATLAHRVGKELLAVTVTGMTAACASPFSWGHHWVWFVPLVILAWQYARTADNRWARLAPVAVVLVAFSWWWTFADRPPMEDSPHPIGIGLFMMPRPDNSVWFAYFTVPFYAGCFVLVQVVTSATVIRRYIDPVRIPPRKAPHHVDCR
ncbi:glycosyltransferase 87 family protein [Nocardia sp. CDC153]|uniref:glycosyltransferase 87 family protein n=1 Tax=Nocardia sp. CDC153 TaxID=3112167 RepID=UPI002DB75762|nr:glycosyltransferase 87 family protein [Nocardia sp. CDC153]MEC3954173.1 glycosyltransferase 87 family protein [Nocardia sp. CDC153]